MLSIAKEVLQYEKDYINYYINIPKIYYEKNNERDKVENKTIESINQLIFQDIMSFMDVVEESYNISGEGYVHINSLTEYQIGYKSKNIVSLSIEFSQLVGFYDISYIKGYNYDFKLKRQITLKDLFKESIDYVKILKKYIITQAKILFIELQDYVDEIPYHLSEDNVCLDEENTFYFTDGYLILPFSSCEIDKDILSLLEFKIPFNKIYHYLSEYAKKNIVKKIIL